MPKQVKVAKEHRAKHNAKAETSDSCCDNKGSFRDEGKQESTEPENKMKQENKQNVKNFWMNNGKYLANKYLNQKRK